MKLTSGALLSSCGPDRPVLPPGHSGQGGQGCWAAARSCHTHATRKGHPGPAGELGAAGCRVLREGGTLGRALVGGLHWHVTLSCTHNSPRVCFTGT
ncbi:hypothetical protein Pmani_035322 [Petrolisthes manimaculis]|uniref:Uncharacterized protein n=1 Tax=Petrolisthes manimaculis TaxID=1843537 RepID=A0AAE1TNJ8_9EUCA|nr:hypothetical protein Pmani_035322 [Petrolisthes manimaculis]